jgi:secreted trypsin-like serine protease
MSRRLLVPLVSLLSLLLTMPVLAITYGQPDGSGHPNVGALVDTDPEANFNFYCSGTLIAPTVFLTAAHCVDGEDQPVYVTFDSVHTASPTLVTGTYHADPAYSQKQGDPHDIAVVILDRSPGITPANLPALGQFDSLRKNQKGQQFTAVGYGREEPVNQPGGPVLADPNVRQYAVSTLNAVNPAWLRLSQNQATGDGGTCYGDSGGPNFLGAGTNETTTIAGITITGDSLCKATNVVYRLDTKSAQSFLCGSFSTELQGQPLCAGSGATQSKHKHGNGGGKHKHGGGKHQHSRHR